MGLTPNEILNKEFSTKFRGYDQDQVNDYLDIIVADYEKYVQEMHDLKQELSTAKEKNEYFAQLQESLNSSIVVAQEAADRLKQNARKEAELIIYEAEKKAEQIVAEASDRAKLIVTETEALRKSSKTYRQRLENIIQSQLNIVASDDYKSLFDTEFETNLQPENFQLATERAANRVDQLEAKDQETDLDQTMVMSKDDFKERSLETNLEVDKEAVDKTDLTDKLTMEEFDKDFEEVNKSESVLGQTIRIELPKQND